MSGNSYNGFLWPERQRAYGWLKQEWAAGRRPKVGSQCDVCGQTAGYLMAHAEDYSAPYGPHIGQWSLCYWCHMLLHYRFRADEVFASYVAVLEGGERFVNLHGPQWARCRTTWRDVWFRAANQPTARLVDPFGPLFTQGAAAMGRRTRSVVS